MSSTDKHGSGWQLTGRHVLLAMLGFFGCVFLVNGIFVYLALDTWSGLSSKYAYREGLDYNQQLAAGAEQRALGWQVEVSADASDGGRWRLSARFLDPGARPIEGLKVKADMRRPAREDLDKSFELQRTSDGLYAVEFEPAGLGNWDVVVTAQRRGATVYRREQRLWLK